ncbi:PcfJ domain-containing protein [Latilactobacillus sakei]|uniref:PcfJ domain-containing protein n=1 Tax=Latilactobacillus sakei TaxID=1599 RepID=UPI0024DF3328|nr:PcfJ domain-containing protein [Latilactobacillus sakei]
MTSSIISANKKPIDYVNSRLKPPKAFFEWCYQSMRTYVWANKQKTIVASDRKHSSVITKRLTKKSRLTFYDYRNYFMIVLATSKRIELQTYKVASYFDNGKQRFETELFNLEVLASDQHIKVGRFLPEYGFGLKQTMGPFSKIYPEVFDKEQWTKRLNKSELRYIRLKDNMWPELLGDVYKRRGKIEFLQKIKANEFAEQLIFHDCQIDMRKITDTFLRETKSFFRNTNYKYSDYFLKLAIEKRGGKMVPGIEQLLNASEVEQLPDTVGIVKMQNYLLKQATSFWKYRDYINMLKELDLPLNKSNVLPKDLTEAHDKALEALNAIKREVVRTEFEERAQEMQQLETTIGPYAFVIPKSADDLIQEGNALHHCVGGMNYINQYADKKTTIIFVRPKEAPDQPKYTAEVRQGEIVQIQGMFNTAPISDELRTAVSQWIEKANRLKVAN